MTSVVLCLVLSQSDRILGVDYDLNHSGPGHIKLHGFLAAWLSELLLIALRLEVKYCIGTEFARFLPDFQHLLCEDADTRWATISYGRRDDSMVDHAADSLCF